MYQTILIDPPWNETGGGKIKRGADRHYPLIKTADLPRVILESGRFKPASNAHLYLWTTSSFLPDGLFLVEALGFTYKSCLVWTKQGRKGLGQYFRMQHEILLLAVRGSGFKVRTESRSIGSVIDAPRGRHSEKPVEFHELIEQRSHGPRLEMFARAPRDGWDSWGNELEVLS